MAQLGIGLAAVGRPAYINLGRTEVLPPQRTVEAMRARTFDVLDAAYESGVRWVDTARSYGRAEEFLAQWLSARGYDDITVSSKWGYAYVGDWRMDAEVHESKEHSLARFQRQRDESVSLLGAALRLYQVHSLTVDSPLFSDEPLLEALAQLGSTGVRVGFSTSGPRQADAVDRALAATASGVPVFTAVQSTWNVLEPSVGPTLERAHASGAQVLIKEAMANGRLAVSPPPELADGDTPPDALALAAAMANPWADVVLSGAAVREQFAANARAADVTVHSGQFAALAEDPGRYWARRSALEWR
jgi:aryl-alcohol dehydrogenase-like predicted oxidoreductase